MGKLLVFCSRSNWNSGHKHISLTKAIKRGTDKWLPEIQSIYMSAAACECGVC